MVEDSGPEEAQKRKKALSLMGDYLQERDSLHEGPRFKTPPFVIRQIEGTKTLYFAPSESAPATPDRQPQAPAPAPKPVSFRRMNVRPDAPPPQKGLPALSTRRPTAKELIAKLRVVKEGVETRKDLLDKMADRKEDPSPVPGPEATEEANEPPDQGDAAAAEMEPARLAAREDEGPVLQVPDIKPSEGPLTPAAESELAAKSEGGKLCPSCGMQINDHNRLFVCNDCGKRTCNTCGGYELAHLKTDVFYDYKFDFPLCITCYDKAFNIQRMLGKSIICYGNGNFSYALYYANQGFQMDPQSKYARKAQDLMDKIEQTKEDHHKRDNEWRMARKHFMRNAAEDPRWK